MTHQKPRTTALWLMLFTFSCAILFSSVAGAANSNTETESLSSSSGENPPESGFRLKFLQKPATDTDNNEAVEHKKGELYLRHRDNEEDSNDSGVSSKSSGLRYRREDNDEPSAGASKVVTTNWGTYEEQAPVVIDSGVSRSFVSGDDDDDDDAIFSEEYRSKHPPNDYGSPAGVGSISYAEYEDGGFQGRQFYPSRGGGYGGSAEQEQEQPDGYYRQKYYATTPKTDDGLLQGEQSKEETAMRPHYPARGGQYRMPPQRKESEDDSPGIMGFVQKAKTFYDIFRAMNSAWKSIEDRYRKNGEGIFLGDQPQQPQVTETAVSSSEAPVTSEKTPKTPRPKTKKRKTTTTKAPSTMNDDEGADEQQAKDEYRSRRSSADGEDVNNEQQETTNSPKTESPSAAELESESDLEASESNSDPTASSSTAVAEGRYIKGDPLKGYYDFVITEGSYKFWAAFQVGTAILIIYSTFAAIYYSKVNPLVSDYDYIDYLGGGRSLSDDSDFVDTDAPAAATDGSKTPTAAAGGKGSSPGGTARSQRMQKQSAAGWFDWLPHAGHSLRFILEAIDKGYTEE